MAVTNIYLVRHGETDYNKQQRIQGQGIDADLNALGEKQSEALALYFKEVGLDHIFSSTLIRAKQTARIIADKKNMPVETFPDLVEMSYGTMEGNMKKEVKGTIDKLHKNWNDGMVTLAPDQGESPVEVYRRANKKLMRLLKQWEGKTLLFVLHGRLMRILLSVWLERGLNRMSELDQDNAAINLIYWDGTSFNADFLNKKDHLNSVTTMD